MRHINFSVRAPVARRRAWNPRGKVKLRSTSLVWNLVSIGAIATTVFAVVWFA